jgi:hypothetical protein
MRKLGIAAAVSTLAAGLLLGANYAAAQNPLGWYVKVCPTKTETGQINMRFANGPLNDAWVWTRNATGDTHLLPNVFNNVSSLYMYGQTTAIPGNDHPNAYMCVGFRDHVVKHMDFDRDEDHTENWNHTDGCDC